MYHPQKHKLILIEILKDFYSDPFLAVSLGFKGGTAMQLFYDLPRFSVDLDFDLLDSSKKDQVFAKAEKILIKHGKLNDKLIKRYNIFFLLSYGEGEKQIKVEINRRVFKRAYELKNFLGIPMLVMAPPSMASHKLLAMLTRRVPAARDLFDAWFMLKNNWQIDEEIIKEKTGDSLKEFLPKAINHVEKYPTGNLLQGMGELLQDAKQKAWVKEKLKAELVFELKKYGV